MSSNKEPVHKFETSIIPSYITSVMGLFVYLSSSVHDVGIVKASLEQPLPLQQSKVIWTTASLHLGERLQPNMSLVKGWGRKASSTPPHGLKVGGITFIHEFAEKVGVGEH